MLIQDEFYYLIDIEPTVYPKDIYTGTTHTIGMKSLPSLENHPVLKGKDEYPSSNHHHLLFPSSQKGNEGMATRNHFKS